MLVDYKKRCVIPCIRETGEHYDIICYGLTASEAVSLVTGYATDIDSPYAELSRGGRRPGSGVPESKHFFNKRIMTDEERQVGRARLVQGGGDVGVVGARNGEGGPRCAQDPEATEGGTGRGDRSSIQEDNSEEVST